MGRPSNAEVQARAAVAEQPSETEKPEVQETASPVLPVAKPNGPLVEITITKFGEGKVSTGFHVAGAGDVFAARGEKIMVSREVAQSLEARGIAEAD